MINPGVGPRKSQFFLVPKDVFNSTNFDLYVETYGVDRAKGFFEATQEITEHLKEILGNLETSGAPVFSAHNIRTNSHLLYKCLENFISEYSNHPEISSNPSPSNP
jgi:hypothetical protein